MAELLVATVDNHPIYIEAEPTYGSEQTTSLDEAVERAGDALEQARTTIVSVATSMVGAVTDLANATQPNEFTLEFAIKFNAEGRAIVAKASAEANLKITMKYVRAEKR